MKLLKYKLQGVSKKKPGKRWRKGKDKTNPKGAKRMADFEKRKEDLYIDIVNKLQLIGDPYDQMDMKVKKIHALHHVYKQMEVNTYFELLPLPSQTKTLVEWHNCHIF